MKKLLAITVALAFTAPAFACPFADHDAAAPKTAEKAPADAKSKEAPKADPKTDAKTDTATKKTTTDKKPADKVSQN